MSAVIGKVRLKPGREQLELRAADLQQRAMLKDAGSPRSSVMPASTRTR